MLFIISCFLLSFKMSLTCKLWDCSRVWVGLHLNTVDINADIEVTVHTIHVSKFRGPVWLTTGWTCPYCADAGIVGHAGDKVGTLQLLSQKRQQCQSFPEVGRSAPPAPRPPRRPRGTPGGVRVHKTAVSPLWIEIGRLKGREAVLQGPRCGATNQTYHV